jgi:hypothetical protein
MPVSHELKCIFVHIPKSGGTSVENALGLLADVRNENTETMFGLIKSPALKKKVRSTSFLQHLTAKELRRLLPSQFSSYYRFAFVRNPWSRMVSLYHYHIRDKRFSFNEFVALTRGSEHWHATTQYSYIFDRKGRCLVDFVGRYERLAADFAQVCSRLDIDRTLPHFGATEHDDYRRYYDDATRKIIERRYREDIEQFGYEFDEPYAAATIPLEAVRLEAVSLEAIPPEAIAPEAIPSEAVPLQAEGPAVNDAEATRRAIVCYIEDNRHLIQQALALRQSWLHAKSPDTDLVVMGPPSALAFFPDDVVKIEQRAVADDPEWFSYRYANSIACMNGAGAHRLDRYSHLLRSDVDTFITPAWNSFYPGNFICGHGGYSHDDDVRQKLRDIAALFGLEHRGLTNAGSTWYGPTPLVRRVAAVTEMILRYILDHYFREDEGAWPGWYAGVSSMYASEIAINHCVPDATRSDQLDHGSTSGSIGDFAHIHCWHTDDKFSKHWFMSERYGPEDRKNLNLDLIPDYAMEMSFRSLEDLAAQSARSL